MKYRIRLSTIIYWKKFFSGQTRVLLHTPKMTLTSYPNPSCYFWRLFTRVLKDSLQLLFKLISFNQSRLPHSKPLISNPHRPIRQIKHFSFTSFCWWTKGEPHLRGDTFSFPCQYTLPHTHTCHLPPFNESNALTLGKCHLPLFTCKFVISSVYVNNSV